MPIHFELASRPSTFYTGIANFDLTVGADVKMRDVLRPEVAAGRVSEEFQKGESFA